MIKSTVNFTVLILVLSLLSCGESNSGDVTTSKNIAGQIDMLVDESIGPIVNEQWTVFKTDYPKAVIDFKYCNEMDLMNSLLNDSIKYKSALTARNLTKNEQSFLASKKRNPQIRKFAIDGIALITNVSSKLDEISETDLLEGLKQDESKYPLVFDNKGSSVIFYLKNKAGIDKFPKNGIFVLEGYQAVVKYVQEHKDYIGVVGLNWVIKNDTTAYHAPPNIKFLSVADSTGKAYKPSQHNLMSGLYPLRRELYIINLKYGYGLGVGFASWLCSDRGQLLILKSGLAPIVEPARELRIIKKM